MNSTQIPAFDMAKLGELLLGCEYGLSKQMSASGCYPIFRMNNIENGRMIADPLAYINLADSEFERYRVRKGDILFNRTNSLDLVGKVGIFDLEGDFVFASYLVRLLVKPGVCPRFVNYYLNSHEGQKRIAAKVTPSIGQANINTTNLCSIWVPKPPECIQKAISNVLDVVSDLIAAAGVSVAKTERLQKRLMRELLSGRIRPDGTPQTKWERRSHEKLGKIPRGWRVEPLKNLATIQRGRFSHRPRNEPRFFGGPYPFIQTAEIVEAKGYIRRHSQTLNDEGLRISRLFSKGTIMITIAANIGDTAIASYDVCATDSVIGITPNPGVNSEFLELSLRVWKRRLEQVATESAQKNINYTNLRPLLIAIPNEESEQAEIATAIFDFERLMDAKRAKITALQRLKKSLMQNLLTGRMRLSPKAIAELTAEAGKSGGA
jgi:type I restriction enzyme S subunit